ncbi:MAG: chromosome segregation protein SMC [Clostridia bacterium]|nr:chromosome segregation protein SMC [Clostridia bacterium]
MRLKKLEIYGFKSFADKVEIIFDDGITGIVGPNGSGKSNINDAVRWVLGEQSVKLLRGARMEDVIFNGTEKRRRLSYCEVTLTFDNSDGALPIDFAEIAVTRRAYRSGDGEYFINHASCRLKDILDLFRDTGIGRDGYSLIGQGRIDEILSARSEDRRQVFEEAAGIVKYKVRRREAEKRLENTRANLARVEDILNELTGRLEPLRRDSEAAREYLQLREELKGLEINVFLLRSTKYEQRIEELRSSAAEYAAAIAENEEKRRLLLEERERVGKRLQVYEAEAASLRERVQSLIQETEARSGDLKLLEERLSSEKKEKSRAEALAEASEGSREGIEARLSELAGAITEQKRLLNDIEVRVRTGEEETAQAEKAASELELRSEEAKKQLIALMNRRSDVLSMQSRYGTMLENIKQRLTALDDVRGLEETKAAAAREDLEKAQARLADSRAALDAARAESLQASERVRLINEHADALTQKLSGLQNEKREVQSRERMLREMQRDYEGYNHAVRQVLVQSRRMQDIDVRGAVAELITVPARYECAVEMALGASLQNIVVGTEEDAKRLISYLRENRLGRATFLPLSAVRGRTLDSRERQLLSMKGCCGLASELVTFDPKYEEIVNFLLGRTVIAEDLDAGIPIMRAGRQAFRLVTVDGDVMNPGGSMTGGSVHSRMTNLLSREREIWEHEKKQKDLSATIEAIEKELKESLRERDEIRAKRTEYSEKVRLLEMQCEREDAQAGAAKDALDARESRLADVTDEITELLEQEKDIKGRASAIESQNENDEHQKVTQAEIASIQKELYEERSRLEELREKLTSAKVDQASVSRDLNAMVSEEDRLQRDIRNLGAAGEDNRRLSLETAARIASLEKTILEQDEKLVFSRKELEEERQRFNDKDKLRASAQKELGDVTARGDALNADAELLSDKKNRCDVSLTRTEAEYKQLCDRIWEDYELTYAGAAPYRKEDFKLGEADRRIAEIRARIKEIGSVNVNAVDEYRETQARVDDLSTQKDDLTKADGDLHKIIEDLTKHMAVKFSQQFRLLGDNFRETFVKLFGGGQASLELTDPQDPLGCDIEIKAQPPGKKLQLLSLLSGGERALTAIAIVFAMLKLKPTPFCFLDEIEAALDDANIDNFAEYLREFSKSTQFVVVTHRKGTMERCDSLYGAAMEEKGVTRLVSVHLA